MIYSGMPNAVYHGFRDWYGSTTLKHTSRSVESFLYHLKQKQKPKMAFERGDAFHVGIEGFTQNGTLKLFNDHVVECPGKTVKSAAFKELKAANPEKAVVRFDEIENLRGMARNLHKKASAYGYFNDGWPELSFFWIDEETGLQLKCRPDWFRPDDGGWTLDYKTFKDYGEEAFAKEIANRNYHFSAAMYLDGIFNVTGIQCENYVFLVAANTPPFEIGAYPPGAASLAEGKAAFRKSLSDIYNYTDDAPLTPATIDMPPWGFKLTERPH